MLRFFSLVVLLFCLCLTSICIGQRYVLPYDNVPISATSWKEIDIKWLNPFNPNVPNTAQLLRPISFIRSNHLIVGHLAKLNMRGIGIPNSSAVLTAIKPLPKSTIQKIQANTQPVIGYFKHYVNDVRTYRFRDRSNHIFSIHATPNHPFWIKSLHIFLPITNVTSAMALVGKANRLVHLICPNNQSHCGKSYRKGHIFMVYNIEVYRRHVYRVGHFNILVHNKNEGQLTVRQIKRGNKIGAGSEADVYQIDGYAYKMMRREYADMESPAKRQARLWNEEYPEGDPLHGAFSYTAKRFFGKDQQVLVTPMVRGRHARMQEIDVAVFDYYDRKRRILLDAYQPGNILVTPEGETKIIDFGFAYTPRTELTQSYSSQALEGVRGIPNIDRVFDETITEDLGGIRQLFPPN